MRVLVLVLLASLVSVSACSAPRECWRTAPAAPITLETAGIYRDGGTLYVEFTDSSGCKYQMSHDRKIGPDRPRCLYINATHPDHEGAVLLDSEGDVAQGAADCLDLWLTSNVDAESLERISSAAGMGKLTRDEMKIARVMDMVSTIRSRPCSPEAYDEFLIRVDRLECPSEVAVGDTLRLRFWGTVGPDGCHEFSHFETESSPHRLDVGVYGRHYRRFGCPEVVVMLFGQELKLPAQFPGEMVIAVSRPGEPALLDTVTVTPGPSSPEGGRALESE